MRPLTPDDLLPLAEYTARRDEFAAAQRAYCERYRQINVGAHFVLLFENRQTLWFRSQEMLRVMNVAEPNWVRRELALANCLLPRRSHLQAGLLQTDISNPVESVSFIIDTAHIPARLSPPRPEDRALGVVTWLDFLLSRTDRALLADYSLRAWIEVNYSLASEPLTEEVRQSLLDDLAMSERDAA